MNTSQWPNSEQDGTFTPVIMRIRSVHRPVGPVAYDCVKVALHNGSVILCSEFGQQPVKPGDVILLGANMLHGSDSEGHITVTTICLDTDYVIDQVRRQYAGFLLQHQAATALSIRSSVVPRPTSRPGPHRVRA